MKNRIIVFFFFVICAICISFSDDSYFAISKKDIQLKLPKNFPKPTYDFKKNPITVNGFTLGRKLFYDPILSKDSSVSCGSCHQQFAGFAHIDHSLSHGIAGRIGKRNVSSLQNLIWSKEFMWDGSINHLEVQPLAPISNKMEMDESLQNVLRKLNNSKEYRKQFYNAFGDSLITSEKLLKTIAQFVSMLVSNKSKYDNFIKGIDEFSELEKQGLVLFRNNCEGCHKEPLFTDNSYRNNGLAVNPKLQDKGRYMVTGDKSDLYKFKVPSLRNLQFTFPYMHDGRFVSIRDVLNYYRNFNKHSSGSDSLIIKMNVMSDKDIQALEAFLLTLTDNTFVNDRRFSDPNFKRN